MKNLRKRNFCNDCQYLDELNEKCSLGIKVTAVRSGFHAFIKVVDKSGCRAARQNRLHEESSSSNMQC